MRQIIRHEAYITLDIHILEAKLKRNITHLVSIVDLERSSQRL